MSRKVIAPTTERSAKRLALDTDGQFAAGVIRDPAASKLPRGALADGFNAIVYPNEIWGRPGKVPYADTPIPAISGRTGYTLTKTGFFIESTVDVFAAGDVSNYVVFPGNPNRHYEIEEFITARRVRCGIDSTIAATADCYLRGKHNLFRWHDIRKLWVRQFYKTFYHQDLDMASFDEGLIVSRDLPANTQGDYAEFDEFGCVISNSNGIFKLDFEQALALAFKTNVPVPDIAVASNEQTDKTEYCRRYLYSAARLTGQENIRTRLTPCRIESETGTVKIDADGRDYGERWTEKPIGAGTQTYQRLVCAPLAGAYANISGWVAIAPNYGTFVIDLNDYGAFEIATDPTDLKSLAQLAELIQTALRDFFPQATCELVGDHFEISPGFIAGGTVTFATAGITGTDIATFLGATAAAGATIEDDTIEDPHVIGPLWVPKVNNTVPQEYQWHLTHFPIWATLNTQGIRRGQLNNEHRYVWLYDLRIAGAFYVHRYRNGIIEALVGEFEIADVGSTIEYENGDRDTIIAYINSHRVRYSANPYYEGDAIMAAAIGNGRVMRASQTGDIVTRTHGDTFSSADPRKTIFWSTGHRSYVRAHLGPNRVQVWDSTTRPVQGITLDPTHRHFNDTVSDDVLDDRQSSMLLRQRFWTDMPNCNVGVIAPGFFISAARHFGDVQYCQLPVGREYLLGFHNPAEQKSTEIKDDIQAMWVFTDYVVVWTSKKTYGCPTNIPNLVTLPEVGEVVAKLPGFEVLSDNIGCFDWGSIRPIGNGQVILLTSEPGGIGQRRFDGHSYGPDEMLVPRLGMGRFKNDFKDVQQATTSIFDGNAGYVNWSRRKSS